MHLRINPEEIKNLSMLEYYDLWDALTGREGGVKITLANKDDYEIARRIKARLK